MESPHLRATLRSVTDDLHLDSSHAPRDVRHYCAEHEALRTFVGKREGAPDVGEPVSGLPSRAYLSLHVSRGRGITIWDGDEDVCWFLAYSPTHATGEGRDAYKYFLRLSDRKELLPTPEDYETIWDLLDVHRIDGLTAIGREMYEDARAAPGHEINRNYGSDDALMVIDLMVVDNDELEEGWVSFTFPRSTPLTKEQMVDLLSRILPVTVNLESLAIADSFKDRAPRFDEVVWTWNSLPAG